MTVVEFFNGVSIENMVSCLMFKPDKIVFLGDRKPMKRQEDAYLRLIKKRGLDVRFEYKAINRNSIAQVITALEEIAEQEDNCTFDLTGGDDLVLVAMGVVYERFKDTKKIQMHRFNVSTGSILDCDSDGILPASQEPLLSVEENILLYGGTVVPYDGEKGTYKWVLDEAFVDDVKTLWDICRSDPNRWNTQLTTLSTAIAIYGSSGSSLKISMDKTVVAAVMDVNKNKYAWFPDLIDSLHNAGFITDISDDGTFCTLRFKNEQIKECLSKAGTVLELIVLIYALSALDHGGKPKYNDGMCGVYIDWDADLHREEDEEKDTENEIDVVLMRGLVPVFISCKNGFVNVNELYKLSAVAEKFGGPYAKKVLISTYYGQKEDDRYKHFVQRAADMKIQLIENAHRMTEEELVKEIRNILC